MAIIQGARFNGPNIVGPEEPSVKWVGLAWYSTVEDRLRIWNGSTWIAEEELVLGIEQSSEYVDVSTEGRDIRTLLCFYQDGLPPSWSPIGAFWITETNRLFFIRRLSGAWEQIVHVIAVFAGGATGSTDRLHTGIESVDCCLFSQPGRTFKFGALGAANEARFSAGAVSNGPGGRMLVAGGYQNAGEDIVRVADINTYAPYIGSISETYGNLTVPRAHAANLSNHTSDRGILAGGFGELGVLAQVDYVSISTPGTAVSWGNLITGRSGACGVSNGAGDRGFIVAGDTANVGFVSIASVENMSISVDGSASTIGSLAEANAYMAGASNGLGAKALIAGGAGLDADPNVAAIGSIFRFDVNAPFVAPIAEFGTLQSARNSFSATGNDSANQVLWNGGFDISGLQLDLIEISNVNTPANSTTFGSLRIPRVHSAATSNA